MDTLFIPNENDFRRWIKESLKEYLEGNRAKDGLQPDTAQEELLLTLSDLVFKSAFLRIVAAMDDSTRSEFAALVEAGASPEVLDDFFKKRVPGAERATKDALEDLAADLAALDIPPGK